MKKSVPRFSLTVRAHCGGAFAPFLRKHLRKAHALIDTHLAELSVALVGDARMSALHEQFMNVAGPTDVLTFPLEFDEKGREIAGEVVVCVSEARRQAAAHQVAVERELLLYALHGMLHLSGFDDRTDPAFRRMHRREDQILTALGLGPVFRPAAGRGKSRSRGNRSRSSPFGV